jgi:hypothetical protein
MKMAIKNYTYGCKAPHVNLDRVNDQILKAHRYRNALVEQERQATHAAKQAEIEALAGEMSQVKILVAVATKGGGRINEHFGHAKEFQIYELSASGEAQGRQLVLTGPGLPFMGAEWASKSVVKTKWYNGNPNATQQALGPQEMPSTWQGDWRRTMLGRSPAQYTDEKGAVSRVVNPINLWNILETIAREGRMLRVIWSVSSVDAESTGQVIREGRMTELHFKPQRLQDIEWTITFDWASRGRPNPLKVSEARAARVGDIDRDYINKLNQLVALNTIASFAKNNPAALTLGQLEAVANYPSTLVNSLARQVQSIGSQVGQVVNIAATLATQPMSIVGRVIDLARNTVSQINGFGDSISRIPAETLTTKSKLADLIRATKTFNKQVDSSEVLAQAGLAFALKMQQQFQAQSAGRTNPSRLANPQAATQVYLTKPGDTPERISMIFYKSPDHGGDILRANKLSWHTPTLPPGKALLIPALETMNLTNTAST